MVRILTDRAALTRQHEQEDHESVLQADECVHGKPWDVICVQCCPEDDDGSFEGDEWSQG